MSGLLWLVQRRARRALIIEAESLLSGAAQELFVLHAQRVPTWARLNALAHGSPASLEAMASDHRGLSAFGTWPWAVGTLARELLDVVGQNHYPLTHVQRSSMVPLELALLAPGAIEPSPRMLVAVGTAAIRAQLPPVE